MYLKELVGKMAIRTKEPTNPFDPLWSLNNVLRGKSGARHLKRGG